MLKQQKKSLIDLSDDIKKGISTRDAFLFVLDSFRKSESEPETELRRERATDRRTKARTEERYRLQIAARRCRRTQGKPVRKREIFGVKEIIQISICAYSKSLAKAKAFGDTQINIKEVTVSLFNIA